jgi:signal transduction histidine kinase
VDGRSLPPDTGRRVAEFIELVGTAIANAEARMEVARLADEQAALRRVATLVARGAPAAEVFRAVAEELGQLLDANSSGLVRYERSDTVRLIAGWGRIADVVADGECFPLGGRNALTEVARTGKPARVDDYSRAASGAIGERSQRVDIETSIGAPVEVSGRLWGAMVASTADGVSLPPDTDRRLVQFCDLVATAIANAEARLELAFLADEQAALRRVATLVAEEAPAAELFRKVGEEVAGLLGSEVESAVFRYEADGTATVLAGSSEPVPGGIVVGERLPLDGSSVSARVFRERCAVRVDDYASAEGAIAEHAAKHEIRGALGCPILVKGRVWGCMVVAHRDTEPFPADTERRVAQFTELVATALFNAEARAELQRLADEQAALRRVATLVAKAATPTELFDAVAVEVAQLLAGARVGMVRAENADECMVIAYRAEPPADVQIGVRLPLAGDSVTSRVLRTGRSTRMNLHDEGHGVIADIARRAEVWTTVGAPITVEGRIWGAITASWTRQDPVPGDAEERLVKFAALLDTAIANADSRDQPTASRARVLTAGDEARRRVVRDLHDGAQQRLVHTLLTLNLAQRALDDEDAEQARSLLAEACGHAEQSNAELRELAHGILPSVLTHGGLRAAVDSVVARLDLPVDTEIAGERLPPEIEASAYFIVAEALTNVVKHAQASRASVTAVVSPEGRVRIDVRDDGIGGADSDGHGLLGIRDRVAALGGGLRIDSPRGEGTVLVAELPLSGRRLDERTSVDQVSPTNLGHPGGRLP